MTLRVFIAFVIFLGSYLPLSLILLAQDYDYTFLNTKVCLKFWENGCSLPFKNPGIAVGLFLVCVICFFITIGCLALVRPKHKVQIKEFNYIPTDLMNYTLPYIVSFMNIDYHEPGKFVGLVIFLGWMFWITYKSGQIILNPILIILGWRLYEVSYVFLGGGESLKGYFLVKGRLEVGKIYRQVPIHDILVVKNSNSAGE